MLNAIRRRLPLLAATESLSSTGEHFRLLDLPRELRDKVYEHALSEPDGLFYRYVESDTTFQLYTSFEAACNRDEQVLEANQLKYVCRQLYSETSGLGLQFNDLNIVRFNMNHPFPTAQLLRFLQNCSPKKLSRLRRIETRSILDDILVPEPESEEGIYPRYRKIADFCSAYPNLILDIRVLPCVQRIYVEHVTEAECLYLDAMSHMLAFRNLEISALPDSAVVYFRLDDMLNLGLRYPSQERTISKFQVPANMRFWPTNRNFDEATFRLGVQRSNFFQNNVIPHIPGGEEGLIAQARSWYKHGF